MYIYKFMKIITNNKKKHGENLLAQKKTYL